MLQRGLAAQPDHHVDAGDLVALGRDRRLADHHVGIRNVDQRVLALDEEVVMLRRVGVEIGLRAVDRDLPQQPDIGELMQRVVDGRQRHRHLGVVGLLEQQLGGDVPVALAEQEPAQLHALAGGPQPHVTQHRLDVVPGATGERGARRRHGCRSAPAPRRRKPWFATGSWAGSWARPNSTAGTALGEIVAFVTCCPGNANGSPATADRAHGPLRDRDTCGWAQPERMSGFAPPPPPILAGSKFRSADNRRDRMLMNRRSSYDYDELLACGRGESVRARQRPAAAAAHADVRPHLRDRRDRRRTRQGPGARRARSQAGPLVSSPATSRAIR